MPQFPGIFATLGPKSLLFAFFNARDARERERSAAGGGRAAACPRERTSGGGLREPGGSPSYDRALAAFPSKLQVAIDEVLLLEAAEAVLDLARADLADAAHRLEVALARADDRVETRQTGHHLPHD